MSRAAAALLFSITPLLPLSAVAGVVSVVTIDFELQDSNAASGDTQTAEVTLGPPLGPPPFTGNFSVQFFHTHSGVRTDVTPADPNSTLAQTIEFGDLLEAVFQVEADAATPFSSLAYSISATFETNPTATLEMDITGETTLGPGDGGTALAAVDSWPTVYLEILTVPSGGTISSTNSLPTTSSASLAVTLQSSFTATAVPEPSAIWLLLLAGGLVVGGRKVLSVPGSVNAER